jgi:peptidoglycan/LPS O-acetylase OafA/YrhL
LTFGTAVDESNLMENVSVLLYAISWVMGAVLLVRLARYRGIHPKRHLPSIAAAAALAASWAAGASLNETIEGSYGWFAVPLLASALLDIGLTDGLAKVARKWD